MIESLSGEQARALLTEAIARFNETLAAQAVVSACAIQPLHEQLTNLAARAGVDATDLLRGHGSHEEARVLADLWARLARQARSGDLPAPARLPLRRGRARWPA